MTTKSTTLLKNYINGKWVEAKTDHYQLVPNPATAEPLAEVPISTKEDVDDAVRFAEAAFKTWSKTPVPKRARILLSINSF